MSDKIVAQIEIDYHWWGSFQPEEDQPAKVVSADGRGFTSDSDLNMKDELDRQVRQEIEDLITTGCMSADSEDPAYGGPWDFVGYLDGDLGTFNLNWSFHLPLNANAVTFSAEEKTYNKPPWIKTGRRTRAMRSAKKQKNMELREKRRAEFASYDNTVELDHDSAEIFWAGKWSGSVNVPGSDGNNYYANFDLTLDKGAEEGNTPVQEPMEFGEMANWRPMDGTPGLKRQRAEGLEEYGRFVDANGKTIMIVSTETVNEDNEEAAIEEFRRLSKGRYPGMSFVRKSAETFNAYSDPISDRQIYKIKKLGGKVDSTMNRSQASDYIKDLMGVASGTWKAEYISDLSNGIVQFEDGYGFSSASAPPNDIHFGAENQVFALTYWIDEGVNIDDITDVSEALELYLSLSDDIAEMEDLELQKHPRYELAKKLQSDLSYRMDELQTAVPDITTDIEMDAEYDAWRSAFADGASATMLHKYDRNWMSKVNNPRSTYIKSYWKDSEPEFMEELRSAEGDYLDRMSFRASYAKPLAVVAGLAAALLAYRKL